ncbi:Protein TSP-7 [Aphelenchoides avenae]|nr:Protein TSP-7 [Aphelenchus avenae]
MVEGGITLVKYLLFIANFVLWASGLAMIVAGAVLQLKYTGLFDILWDARLATPVLLLAVGFICALLGFLGCCGAIRENYCLTLSFAVLLALLLFVEIVVAIFAYAMHDTVESGLVQQLTQGMQRYNKSSGVQMAWDETQRQLECCGVSNTSDWGHMIPDSCCVHFHPGCARMVEPSLFQEGCLGAVEEWLTINAAFAGGITALAGAIQIIGICFACCLSKSILKDFNEYYY